MKIVFIGPFGLQPKGTMSQRALPLARALINRGHKVSILIPPWDDPGRAGQSWPDQGVQIINVPLPSGWLFRRPLLFHALLTRTLVSQALAEQPEVIHFFKPKAYAGLAHLGCWWLRRWRGLPVRLVVDTDDWEQAWNEILPYSVAEKKFFTWQEKWGLSRADAVTVASQSLVELVTTQIQAEPDRVFYVPNGCCTALNSRRADRQPEPARNQFWTGQDRLTILLYSRFVEFRLERIVTLVKMVAEQLPEVRWLVVGRGFQHEEETLEAKLSQSGLNQYVHFTGWAAVDQLPAYFAMADVAIYPYDNTMINRTKCSVKLIELLAAGLPVVADAVGQNKEYIQHGLTGLLTPPEDDLAFGQALVTLLQEPELRQKFSQAAPQYLQENFSWSHLAQIVEKAYR